MNSGWASGFVTALIYSNGAEAIEESKALITEDGHFNILTENGQDILTES